MKEGKRSTNAAQPQSQKPDRNESSRAVVFDFGPRALSMVWLICLTVLILTGNVASVSAAVVVHSMVGLARGLRSPMKT